MKANGHQDEERHEEGPYEGQRFRVKTKHEKVREIVESLQVNTVKRGVQVGSRPGRQMMKRLQGEMMV